MKFQFALCMLAVSFKCYGVAIQSDCTAAELKTLKSPVLTMQVLPKGNVVSLDCTPFKGSNDREQLVVIQTFNASGGYQSYLSVYDRQGLNEKSVAQFKSGMVGFDMFPVFYNKLHRLMFIHPYSDKSKLILYMN